MGAIQYNYGKLMPFQTCAVQTAEVQAILIFLWIDTESDLCRPDGIGIINHQPLVKKLIIGLLFLNDYPFDLLE